MDYEIDQFKIDEDGLIYVWFGGAYRFVSTKRDHETRLEALARLKGVLEEYDRIQAEEIEE